MNFPIGTWFRDYLAPDEVKLASTWVAPKLGQACCQASMATSGKRYAFVFDNPTNEQRGFYWCELAEIPKSNEQ